jgi:hypothetical protein
MYNFIIVDVSNPFLTFFLSVKIHINPTQIIRDPHNFMEFIWFLTNQIKCVE